MYLYSMSACVKESEDSQKKSQSTPVQRQAKS